MSETILPLQPWSRPSVLVLSSRGIDGPKAERDRRYDDPLEHPPFTTAQLPPKLLLPANEGSGRHIERSPARI